MHTITTSRSIDAPAARVWELLSDFGGIEMFHPSVQRSPIVNGVSSGLGAQRVCHFYNGSTVKETIVRFHDERLFEVELSEYSLPLNCACFRMEVVPSADGGALARITFWFAVRFGVLGWVLGKVLIEWLVRRDAARVLKGLDDHLRTGRIVGRGGKLLSERWSAS